MNSKYEQIDRYWQGLLEGEELSNFEKKMQEDIDFTEEVNLYNEIEKSIAHRISHKDEERKLRSTLDTIANSTEKQTTKLIKMRSYTKWLVAASIALLVGLFIFRNDTATYSDYANHEQMNISVRGDSNEMLEKAQIAFNEKDYSLAIKYFDKLAIKDNAEIQIYYGISFIETNQYNKAKRVLVSVANGKSLYKNKANWYLALAALKQNELATCSTYLKQIDKGSDSYDKAKELLDKIQ